MNDFEGELRSVLRRVQPSPGFADRVVARTVVQSAPRRSGWLAAAIAACLLVTLLVPLGSFEYRQYRGRKAKQELLMALELAGGKLNMAQKKISALSWRTIHD